MIGPVAIDSYLPSFGSIAKNLHVSEAAVQQTLSVYLISFAISTLFIGTLSDRFGRKPVAVISLIGFSLTSVLASFSPNLEFLIFCRAFQGIFGSVGVVIGQSIVKDKFEGADARRMLANILMVFSIAPAIAPIMGGFLESHFSWRANFYFMAAFTALIALLCIFKLEESLPINHRHKLNFGSLVSGYLGCFTNPTFTLRAMSMGFSFGGIGIYIASASGFIVHILGLKETDFGWLFIPMVCGMIIGSRISAHFADNISATKMVFIGMVIGLSAAIINFTYNFLFTPKLLLAIIPLFIFAIGMTMTNPCINLMTLELMPERKGLASSASNFMRMAVFSMGSGVIAPLVFNSAHNLALAMLGSYAIAVALWFLSLKTAELSTK